jgi:hypothetical protein
LYRKTAFKRIPAQAKRWAVVVTSGILSSLREGVQSLNSLGLGRSLDGVRALGLLPGGRSGQVSANDLYDTSSVIRVKVLLAEKRELVKGSYAQGGGKG